jgi:hypothetical protein
MFATEHKVKKLMNFKKKVSYQLQLLTFSRNMLPPSSGSSRPRTTMLELKEEGRMLL